MGNLSPREIETLREKLSREREEISAELARVAGEASFGTDTEDPDEAIDGAEEAVNRRGIRSALEAQLHRLNAAFGKIDAGTYGSCERCRSPIDFELLSADPESQLCRSCKQGGHRS